MGCHFLLQGIFLSQESNPGPLHCRQILYHLSYYLRLCFPKPIYTILRQKRNTNSAEVTHVQSTTRVNYNFNNCIHINYFWTQNS